MPGFGMPIGCHMGGLFFLRVPLFGLELKRSLRPPILGQTWSLVLFGVDLRMGTQLFLSLQPWLARPRFHMSFEEQILVLLTVRIRSPYVESAHLLAKCEPRVTFFWLSSLAARFHEASCFVALSSLVHALGHLVFRSTTFLAKVCFSLSMGQAAALPVLPKL